MRKTIEEVCAEAAIKDVQIRYCRACDRADYDLLRECFHPDATTKYGFFGGSVDEFIASAREQLPLFLATTHNTGNQTVDVKGDTAWAEHYTVATHRLAADAHGPLRDFVTAVRYIDRMECRDGDWRIAARSLVLDWTRTDPLGDVPPDPDVARGQRGTGDPSYAMP
jgi:3-phenylpropionate/cinnamic acid dioxygenase small subunit